MADITQVADPMDVDLPARPTPPVLPLGEHQLSSLADMRFRYPVLNSFDYKDRDHRRKEMKNRLESHSRRRDFVLIPKELLHLCMPFGMNGNILDRPRFRPLNTRHNSLVDRHKVRGSVTFTMTDDENQTFWHALSSFWRLIRSGEIYKSITVEYFDPAGARRGRDFGGLSAEFWTKIGSMIAKTNAFVIFPDRENVNWYFTANKCDSELLRLIGAMLAKALLEKATLPISLSPIVYKLICGGSLEASDLSFVDPELWNRLNSKEGRDIYISNEFTFRPIVQDPRFKKNAKDWCLDTLRDKDEVVTEETYDEWVHLQCHFILLKSVRHTAVDILKGFYSVIPQRRLVRDLNPKELSALIEGQHVMDATAFLKYCRYSGESKRRNWFKNIVLRMNQDQLRNLLFFISGFERLPCDNSRISIKERTNLDKAQLPCAHTCSKTMDMPMYETESTMQKKLLQAIETRGFAFA